MPKQYATSSIGYDLSFSGPASIEEYNGFAGANVLEDAIRGLIAWDTLPDWQDKFAKRVTELTGEERQLNEKATAEAKSRAKSDSAKENAKVYETVTKFVNRVKAKFANDENVLAQLKAAAQDVANDVTIDPSPSKRAGKIKAEYLAKADTWLSLSDDALESKITGAQEEGVNYPLQREENGRPERESLARFIGAFIDLRMQQTLKDLG